MKQLFDTVIVLPDDGPVGLKHIGLGGFYNLIVNVIVFVGWFKL